MLTDSFNERIENRVERESKSATMGKNRSSKKKKNGTSNGPDVRENRKDKSLDTFGNRKRHLEPVSFVYPKDNKGSVAEYLFGKQRLNGEINQQSPSNQISEHESKKNSLSQMSLDDILNGVSNKIKADSDSTPATSGTSSSSYAEDAEDIISPDHSRESEQGHLSGKSLEEVIRDKAGCRPRANSTDGELALPQRGLCDERTVLTKHKWSSSYLKQRKSSKAVGLTNLGNTVSSYRCLYQSPITVKSHREFAVLFEQHHPVPCLPSAVFAVTLIHATNNAGHIPFEETKSRKTSYCYY